jgi:hypothetical protein
LPAFNPNFSVEKFTLGDDDPDLQIVLQFVASVAAADFAFQLQNPGLITLDRFQICIFVS